MRAGAHSAHRVYAIDFLGRLASVVSQQNAHTHTYIKKKSLRCIDFIAPEFTSDSNSPEVETMIIIKTKSPTLIGCLLLMVN